MVDEQVEFIISHALFDVQYYLKQLRTNHSTAACGLSGYSDPHDIIRHYVSTEQYHHLSPNLLFDTAYYHEQYPDICTSNMSALYHFLKHGWSELRNPHPIFDTKLVMDQMQDRTVNPLVKYINSPPGTYNPHLLVEEDYVLEQLKEIGIEVTNVLVALLELNIDDINPSHAFDINRYLNFYPDLRRSSPNINALYHYTRYGKAEGRWIFHDSASLNGIEKQMREAKLIEPSLFLTDTNIYELPFTYSKNDSLGIRRAMCDLVKLFQPSQLEYVYVLSGIHTPEERNFVASHIRNKISECVETKIAALTMELPIINNSNWLPTDEKLILIDASTISDPSNIDHRMIVLRALAMALLTSECKNLMIYSSPLGRDLIKNYGEAIANYMEIYGLVFIRDQGPELPQSTNISINFKDCLTYLKGVTTNIDGFDLLDQCD